jgi:hypothetical protein
LACPSRSWSVPRSAPASNRWVAKLCRSVWGEPCLMMPARFAAARYGSPDAFSVIGASARQLFYMPGTDGSRASSSASTHAGSPAPWDSTERPDHARPCLAEREGPCVRCRYRRPSADTTRSDRLPSHRAS